MKKYKISLLVSALVFLPLLVYGQPFQGPSNVQELINVFGTLITSLTPIAMAAALLFFFWGLARFILASGNQVEKEKGRDLMIWGVIALFVMASIWGIVTILQNSFVGVSTGSLDVDNILIDYP